MVLTCGLCRLGETVALSGVAWADRRYSIQQSTPLEELLQLPEALALGPPLEEAPSEIGAHLPALSALELLQALVKWMKVSLWSLWLRHLGRCRWAF